MDRQLILVLDFGGQYNQLIARRVRDLNVYCEMVRHDISAKEVKEKQPIGIILTGGPHNSFEKNAPMPQREIFELGIPVLGICYGCQSMAQLCGGKIGSGPREYGRAKLKILSGELFYGVPAESYCYMSHTNYIEKVPDNFKITCTTDSCAIAGLEDTARKLYGVQFHPEVLHTEYGTKILENFLFKICKASGDWTMSDFVMESIEKIRAKVGKGKALCALSGGVDSAVAATLMHRACPDLVCIFVDHGLLRKDEADQVMRVFRDQQKINVIKVDAAERFLKLLSGVKDPEKKRKIIGEEFIRVFEEEARKLGKIDYLVQGTIYPDVIESGTGISAVIKSHHNVGGLPDVIDFKEIIEPLRDLFKDEVRRCGLELGLSEEIIMRQPFPGPGLAIRVIGEITFNKLETLREADFILRDEIKKAGLSRDIWQYFVVLTDIRSVGVMGDERTYESLAAIRAVTSTDGMSADWARIPYETLEKISLRIINEVKHINRVVYDITSKPPATIEWE